MKYVWDKTNVTEMYVVTKSPKSLLLPKWISSTVFDGGTLRNKVILSKWRQTHAVDSVTIDEAHEKVAVHFTSGVPQRNLVS